MDTLPKVFESSEFMTPDMLLEKLASLGIEVSVHHHKPLFTVADGHDIERDIPGTHCRNLFLRDRKNGFFLLVLQNDTKVDLKKMAPMLGASKFSFGSADDLWRLLGVRPGSVCPFAIANDKEFAVRLCLDTSMMEAGIVNYHPLINTMTVGLSPASLLKFVESCGRQAHIVDLSSVAPDNNDKD